MTETKPLTTMPTRSHHQAFGRFQYPTPPLAVFDEDVIAHYTEFLDRRRAKRPQTEYRRPTDEEWSDFQEHFDKRKVELGSCGRPYGTPCAHEHACIRCPMLSINPKMLPRLDELEACWPAANARSTKAGAVRSKDSTSP